jgi:hypothetical protein
MCIFRLISVHSLRYLQGPLSHKDGTLKASKRGTLKSGLKSGLQSSPKSSPKSWTVKNSDSLSVTDFFPHLPTKNRMIVCEET